MCAHLNGVRNRGGGTLKGVAGVEERVGGGGEGGGGFQIESESGEEGAVRRRRGMCLICSVV